MSQVEKLRALLAEARESVEHDAEACAALMPKGTADGLWGLLQRIDAALAEPVVDCPTCKHATDALIGTLEQNRMFQDDLLRMQAEVERLRDEVARWSKSFGGHVYVTNEKYMALVGAYKRGAEASVKTALNHPANCHIYDNGRCTCGG